MPSQRPLPATCGDSLLSCLQNSYNDSDPNNLYARGVLNAIASGTLVYVSLVEMVAVDFYAVHDLKLQAGMLFMLCVGCGSLALLAYWA